MSPPSPSPFTCVNMHRFDGTHFFLVPSPIPSPNMCIGTRFIALWDTGRERRKRGMGNVLANREKLIKGGGKEKKKGFA